MALLVLRRTGRSLKKLFEKGSGSNAVPYTETEAFRAPNTFPITVFTVYSYISIFRNRYTGRLRSLPPAGGHVFFKKLSQKDKKVPAHLVTQCTGKGSMPFRTALSYVWITAFYTCHPSYQGEQALLLLKKDEKGRDLLCVIRCAGRSLSLSVCHAPAHRQQSLWQQAAG